MASTVLAIVSASCMLPLVAAGRQAQEADRLKYAVEIGQALIEEITARPVVDSRVSDTVLGPSAMETSRKAYLNVDAFNGFTESGQPLQDYEGATMAGTALQGFWRTASTQYVTYSGQVSGDTSSFVLVTVNVYYGTRLMTTFSRLAAVEQ